MAKTIRTKVYRFNELKKPAKENAIDWYRHDRNEYFFDSDNTKVIETFESIISKIVDIKEWSYGSFGYNDRVRFEFKDDTIENLTGLRLMKYLLNNFYTDFYSRIYIKLLSSKKYIQHKKIVSKPINDNGEFYNSYKLFQRESENCPLTGYCLDNALLQPIWDFIKQPKQITFKELLEQCFDAWIKACNNDIEYCNTDEFITEEIENNDYWWTNNGEIFNH
jgi:hypothetical protein